MLDSRDDGQGREPVLAGAGGEHLVDLGTLPPGDGSTDLASTGGSGVRRGWRSLRVRALALAVFALGAGVGGVVTHWWDIREQRQDRDSVVSVQVVVTSSLVGSGGVNGARVEMDATVMLVNSGPLPVEVSDVEASDSGLSVKMKPTSLVARPGVLAVPVRVVVDCQADAPMTIRLGMTVRPTHGPPRQVSPLMATTDWVYLADNMCLSLLDR